MSDTSATPPREPWRSSDNQVVGIEAAASAATPWYKKHWVHLIAAFVVGGAIGTSSEGSTEDTPTAAEPEPAVTETVTITEEAEPARTITLDPSPELQAALDARSSELDLREADLVAREEAVTGQEQAAEAGRIPGDGVYIVGTDVQPGTYRTAGGTSCYWARLELNNEIIDNFLGDGSAVVTIEEGDALFETNDCGEWTLVQ